MHEAARLATFIFSASLCWIDVALTYTAMTASPKGAEALQQMDEYFPKIMSEQLREFGV